MSQFDIGLAIGFTLGVVVMLIAIGVIVIRMRENSEDCVKPRGWVPPANFPPPPIQPQTRKIYECGRKPNQ